MCRCVFIIIINNNKLHILQTNNYNSITNTSPSCMQIRLLTCQAHDHAALCLIFILYRLAKPAASSDFHESIIENSSKIMHWPAASNFHKISNANKRKRNRNHPLHIFCKHMQCNNDVLLRGRSKRAMNHLLEVCKN